MKVNFTLEWKLLVEITCRVNLMFYFTNPLKFMLFCQLGTCRSKSIEMNTLSTAYNISDELNPVGRSCSSLKILRGWQLASPALKNRPLQQAVIGSAVTARAHSCAGARTPTRAALRARPRDPTSLTISYLLAKQAMRDVNEPMNNLLLVH